MLLFPPGYDPAWGFYRKAVCFHVGECIWHVFEIDDMEFE